MLNRTEKKLVDSVWIFFLTVAFIALTIYFGYFFLFAEELHIKDKSVEDEIVSSDSSWIQKVLSKGGHDVSHENAYSNKLFSQQYGQYLFLDKHCSKIISESKPKFTKLVLFVIDAFRADFVSSISSNKLYSSSLPYMKQMMQSHGKSNCFKL